MSLDRKNRIKSDELESKQTDPGFKSQTESKLEVRVLKRKPDGHQLFHAQTKWPAPRAIIS